MMLNPLQLIKAKHIPPVTRTLYKMQTLMCMHLPIHDLEDVRRVEIPDSVIPKTKRGGKRCGTHPLSSDLSAQTNVSQGELEPISLLFCIRATTTANTLTQCTSVLHNGSKGSKLPPDFLTQRVGSRQESGLLIMRPSSLSQLHHG